MDDGVIVCNCHMIGSPVDREFAIVPPRRLNNSIIALIQPGVAYGRWLRDRSVLGLRPHRTLEANRPL